MIGFLNLKNIDLDAKIIVKSALNQKLWLKTSFCIIIMVANVACSCMSHIQTAQDIFILWKGHDPSYLVLKFGSGQPRLRRTGLPSNSTMQVINIRILIVPVTTSRNMNMISLDIFFKLVISYLFESIHLHFFESIRLLLLWKYSFAIFLKVFVCYYFESIRLMCYYGHSELWTMNCYELLETVIWTALRDPEGECVVVCVMNDVNKEL